jgi:nicotinamidase-related amidase
MNTKVDLLLIDYQNDFCLPTGALSVAGALEDAERVARMIRRLSGGWYDIHATLDSHHLNDVAHPGFWKDKNGKQPGIYTLIRHQDILDGTWVPRNPVYLDRMLVYTKTLEASGKYILCVWPPHCLIGTPGHNFVDSICSALLDWEKNEFAMVDKVTKGSNFLTEHYSAIQADVPDPSDPSTMLNTRLIQTLQDSDCIVIAGEAKSHCVKFTVEDIANNFGDENIKKMVYLEDACSNVTGFETQGDEFVHSMIQRGMQISTTDKFKI